MTPTDRALAAATDWSRRRSWPPPTGAPTPPCDHPAVRELAQQFTAARAERDALRRQLHEQENRLAIYEGRPTA